jgi:hypothetical protein
MIVLPEDRPCYFFGLAISACMTTRPCNFTRIRNRGGCMKAILQFLSTFVVHSLVVFPEIYYGITRNESYEPNTKKEMCQKT